MAIVVRGDGVAALTCSYLLQTAGFNVAIERLPRPHLPALMLSASSQALFCDILKTPQAFSALPRIQTRVVKWGPNVEMLVLPHSAVIVSEEFLLDRIAKTVRFNGASDDSIHWTIVSSRPLPEPSVEHAFGERMATIVPVQLESRSARATCWIESVEGGWLFLLPDDSRAGWLMSVGGRLDTQLAGSGVVAAQVAHLSATSHEFPAYPRVAWPLAGKDWIACGTAALAFDPLCGDGTGHAIREAILAAAVVRAAADGGDIDELVKHFQTRLVAGFKRHLAVCSEFYESGGFGSWWKAELQSVREGLAWCDHQLTSAGDFRYRLRGFELERVPG
jgi:hypothetical protein